MAKLSFALLAVSEFVISNFALVSGANDYQLLLEGSARTDIGIYHQGLLDEVTRDVGRRIDYVHNASIKNVTFTKSEVITGLNFYVANDKKQVENAKIMIPSVLRIHGFTMLNLEVLFPPAAAVTQSPPRQTHLSHTVLQAQPHAVAQQRYAYSTSATEQISPSSTDWKALDQPVTVTPLRQRAAAAVQQHPRLVSVHRHVPSTLPATAMTKKRVVHQRRLLQVMQQQPSLPRKTNVVVSSNANGNGIGNTQQQKRYRIVPKPSLTTTQGVIRRVKQAVANTKRVAYRLVTTPVEVVTEVASGSSSSQQQEQQPQPQSETKIEDSSGSGEDDKQILRNGTLRSSEGGSSTSGSGTSLSGMVESAFAYFSSASWATCMMPLMILLYLFHNREQWFETFTAFQMFLSREGGYAAKYPTKEMHYGHFNSNPSLATPRGRFRMLQRAYPDVLLHNLGW